jgi:hypothetical protein
VPTARSQRSGPDRKPLKTVTPERVHTTTVSDPLANRWQTAVRSAPSMRQAGCWTRSELVVCGGAPRRNRTGDPTLTMEPPGTAVRTAVSPGHTRPSGPKLSVLFRRSYAFTYRRTIIVRASRNDTGSCLVGAGCDPNTGSQSAIAAAGLAIGRLERFEQVNSPITGPFLQRSGSNPFQARNRRQGLGPKARQMELS